MSSTSHSPRSVKSLRRFVTVVACEFRFAQQDLEKLGEETVGLGIDIVWNVLAEKARENGGLVLPLHGSSANIVFGYPNPDTDHAARAVQCARQFVDAAVAERNNAQWIPSFGVGIHSADSLILEQGHRSSRGISISGAAPDCAALLSHVPRNGEILLTESTLRTFSSDLPSGLETIEVQFEKEPDLDGLNWEAVVFLGLPDHLRREAVLAGPGVADNPGEAEYFFRYLFSIKIVSARTTLNILSLQAVEDAPSFFLQAQATRSEDEMTRLGAYTLIKRLGKGGTGQVWLARDFHGNLVALKSLQEAFAGDERQISRLQREARAMASLPHHNICQVYEVGETDGLHYIAMEYVSGITLADLLWSGSGAFASSGTIAEIIELIQKWQQSHEPTEMGSRPRNLPFPETLRLFSKVCEAVTFAHEHGILHRDLKPGNILLRENGEPVVSDFGLAKLEATDTENSLSLHGEILGTLDYMAPEQAHDSKNVDERADIYGLGAILYLLLSGRPHFSPSGDILKDASRLQTHEPKPLRSIVGHLHPDIALIAEKCLRPHRHDRYQSARMLRDDLERFLLGQPILARPPSPLRLVKDWTLKHRAIVGTVAAAVFVLLLFAFYSFAQINRKRIAAEEALATARKDKASADDYQKRLVSALQEASQNRLRADSAESDKNKIMSDQETERTSLEAKRKEIERQQRDMEEQGKAFADASTLTAADSLPGDDLANPTEPPRKTDSSARGTAFLLNYSRKLTERLYSVIKPLLDHSSDRYPTISSSSVDEVLCLAKQLSLVSEGDPQASVLLTRLSVWGIYIGKNQKVVKSLEYKTVVDAQFVQVAQAFSRTFNPFANSSVSTSFLKDFLVAQSKETAFFNEPFQIEEKPGSGLMASGANDRNITLLADFAKQSGMKAGPLSCIDMSYSPATVIPWKLAVWCQEFKARKSSATGFSGPYSDPPFPLKRLDLANSSFKDVESLPPRIDLEYLNLDNCPVPDACFAFNFKRLRELYMAGVPFVSMEKAANLDQLDILRFSPRLVSDQKSIEVLRGMKSLKYIGTEQDNALLPAEAFWKLYDAGYFRPDSEKKWPGRMPEVGPKHLEAPPVKNTPAPTPSVPPAPSSSSAQKPEAKGWWPFNLLVPQTPNPKPSPVIVPLGEKVSEVSDIVIRMNALFASFPRSAPADQILEKLRPLIGSFGTCLNTMNSLNSKDPAYVLLCAKYDSLLMDGANVSDLLQHAGKLAVESNAPDLVEECRTLQETLQQTDNGGALITPFGLRRTGTPDNIRLAALYENIAELTKRYTKSTGLPFPPDLLLRESQPSTR